MYCGFKTMRATTHMRNRLKRSTSKYKQCACPTHGSDDSFFQLSLPWHLQMRLVNNLLLTLVPASALLFDDDSQSRLRTHAHLTREVSTDKGAFSIVLYLQQSKQDKSPAAK